MCAVSPPYCVKLNHKTRFHFLFVFEPSGLLKGPRVSEFRAVVLFLLFADDLLTSAACVHTHTHTHSLEGNCWEESELWNVWVWNNSDRTVPADQLCLPPLCVCVYIFLVFTLSYICFCFSDSIPVCVCVFPRVVFVQYKSLPGPSEGTDVVTNVCFFYITNNLTTTSTFLGKFTNFPAAVDLN